MLKKLFVIATVLLCATTGFAQKKDTVIVNLAKSSQIIFTIEDKNDLEVLRHYDFQKLFEDVLEKVAEKSSQSSSDSLKANDQQNEEVAIEDSEESEENIESNEEAEEVHWEDSEDSRWRDDSNEEDENDDGHEWHYRRWNRTWQTFNFDLGTNNYLEDGDFPSDDKAYAVRPWGSWYIGLSSTQRSRIARHFYLEWGLGLSWYNFKFEDDNTLIVKTDNGVEFTHDDRDVDFKKSKLSVSYIHASLVPVFDLGDFGHKRRMWDSDENRSFRLGFGPYAGYRIGSHSKLVYQDDGREKDKDRDSFYLNNFRYGLRLQVGYRSTDLFFNYDLNELFKENKGPKLNAFSFGVIF